MNFINSLYFNYFIYCTILCVAYQNHTFPKRVNSMLGKHLKRLRKKENSIILIQGNDSSQGNVLIKHRGKWGNVCDDEWDITDGNVVCKQLGYKKALQVTYGSYFGRSTHPFWMDNIYCDGKERKLSECNFEGWGLNDCDITEAAGVICESFENKTSVSTSHNYRKQIRELFKEPLQVRLAGGTSRNEGRVEIRYKHSGWGVIYGNDWNILQAMVVCRTLGLGYAKSGTQGLYISGKVPPIVLKGVFCRGNETVIDECFVDSVHESKYTRKDNEQIAGVVCTTVLPDLTIDAERIMKSSYIEDRALYYLQCAMEENCLASTAYRLKKENQADWIFHVRKLLRFTAHVTNIGNTDFRPIVPKNLWEFHQCHMHYHSMEVFATFDVLNLDGEKVAEGHKASFCLEDNWCAPGIKPSYSCANYGDQGISVNCSDIYMHGIDCQWVDISELNPGIYTFKVTVNPELKVAEMTFNNNMAVCSMYYTGVYVKMYNCHTKHP